MTLICELELDFTNMYLHIINKVSRLKLSKVSVRRDRQTVAQTHPTEDIITPHSELGNHRAIYQNCLSIEVRPSTNDVYFATLGVLNSGRLLSRPTRVHYIDWISAKVLIFNFPRYCSNMPKVRWAMSYGFCSKFHTLSSSAKILRIG